MDSTRLRYFATVARLGSVRQAADVLYVSPGTISKGVRLLEREIGCTLLERDGRSIRLTDTGVRVADQAEKALVQLAKLQRMAAPDTDAPIVRIGSTEFFTTWFIGPLLKQSLPGVRVALGDVDPGEMEDALADDIIDAGITWSPHPRDGLESQAITTMTMGVYGRAEQFEFIDAAHIPFVVPSDPCAPSPFESTAGDGWDETRHPRNVAYRCYLLESALELCRRGMAVALLPDVVVRRHNAVVRPEFALTQLDVPIPSTTRRTYDVHVVRRSGDLRSSKYVDALCSTIAAFDGAASNPAPQLV